MRAAPSDVVIRRADALDATALRAFTCENPGELWTFAPQQLIHSEVPRWLTASDAIVLVADRDGETVGVIAVTRQPAEHAVYLSQVLAVAPAHRRQYIGYSLKRAAMEIVLERGGSLVTSEVDEQNVAMRACNQIFHASTAPEPGDPSTLITTVKIAE